jgi:hypothetical protein
MGRLARTLPIASASGELDFKITDGDWNRIEKAYGKQLSASVRKKIFDATTGFLLFECFERTAEPRSWAIDRVRRLRKSAEEFNKALLKDTHQAGVSRIYADNLIERYLDHPRLGSREKLRHLRSVLVSVSAACRSALKAIEDPNVPRRWPGECWDRWVCRLTAVFNASGLPSGARKDSDKRRADGHSPFVMFVYELQRCAPREARRHVQSKDALANAIQVARRRRSSGK